MAYDVFISYSRKDTKVADRICEALEKVGISYFIDRQGIGGGFEFPLPLAENIVSSKIFLFLASENSYNSKFTINEIVFAFNKKEKNSILPYIIDNSSLPLDLELVFAGVNWRNIKEHPIEKTLVSDILKLLGRETQPKPTPTTTYRVGDYYDDGTKQGVVFEVTGDGKHGKIVSLTESCDWLQWSSDDNEQKRLIDAFNDYSGASNMVKVKLIEGWYEKYPAFAWCADLGKGWYLPTKEELRNIFRVKNQLNELLVSKGVPSLNGGYWSSTEINEKICGRFCAWFAYIGDDSTYNNYSADSDAKNRGYYVRAVSAF